MRTFILAAILAFSSYPSSAEEIFSKDDARRVFDLSFQEWKANVMILSEHGVAQYDTLSPLEYTLIVDVPFGRVVTTPTYSSENSKPSKISVTIIYRSPESSIFLDRSLDQHKEFVAEVYNEMLPEYTVMTEINVYQSQLGVVKSSQIFRVGDYPILDATASKHLGCWQQCVTVVQ